MFRGLPRARERTLIPIRKFIAFDLLASLPEIHSATERVRARARHRDVPPGIVVWKERSGVRSGFRARLCRRSFS